MIAILLAGSLLFVAVETARARERPVALVRTRLSKVLTQRDLVSRDIDVLAVYPDGRIDIAVCEDQLAWLREIGVTLSVLERADLAAPAALDENLGLYHTYAETEAFLDSLHNLHPALTRIDTLGFSWEGRTIRAIKISDNAAVDEEEPEVLIMGCHHARELMSVEVPLLFAGHLLAGYGTSPQIASLIDAREVWIVPMLNPDGHVYVQNHHGGDWWTWWRKNRRNNGDGSYGVDLNRNYSYQWGYDNIGSSSTPSSLLYRGPSPFSEPETQAVRDFCASRSFSLALSYHSYSELILYPWGYASLYTLDHALFATLADSLQRGNGYTTGNTATGAIYVTNGGSDDWAYGETAAKNRFYCYTVELNSYEEGGFAPPESLIQPTFEKVLELNLTLLRRAGEPRSVMGPIAPTLYAIEPSPTPTFKLRWSGADPGDPNTPISYDLVELKELRGIADSCEAGDALWELDGFTLSSALAKVGVRSFYSGNGDNLYQTMTMVAPYTLGMGTTLTCWLWYDIEPGWDYAYLEASSDQGFIWMTVPGNLTTTEDPNGRNRGNGITGTSAGWRFAQFDLDDLGVIWEDAILMLRFAYVTDDAVSEAGIYVDMVTPTAAFDARTVIASSRSETFFYRSPTETGDLAYHVQAIDGEGHRSRRSNLVHTTVDDLTPAGVIPLSTGLEANYPNPFNPETTIRFAVGPGAAGAMEPVPVCLAICDCAGRRLAVLERRHLAPGLYHVRWDGRNDAGEMLASGVYFARLVVGGRSYSNKLVLLR